MPGITLTIETGSVVAGANSFISLADFKIHCDNRGRAYSSYGDELVKAALIKGAEYLNNLSWNGVKTGRENPMSWPRFGQEVGGSIWNMLEWPTSAWVGVLDRNGFYIPTNKVPQEVVLAQCEGAWLILTGTELQPNLTSAFDQVIREKVDVIEIGYASAADQERPRWSIIEDLLRGLLKGRQTVTSVRA